MTPTPTGCSTAGRRGWYSVSYHVAATDLDPLVNTAAVDGLDRDAEPVAATDSHSLNIDYRPAIDIVKTGPTTAAVGDTVTYQFAVSHGGSSDGSALNAVAVNDNVTGTATFSSGDDGDGVLETGETWIFTDTHVITPSTPVPLVNLATVTAVDLDGETVSRSDGHSLTPTFNPTLAIAKSGPATARIGESVTYSFAVQSRSDIGRFGHFGGQRHRRHRRCRHLRFG